MKIQTNVFPGKLISLNFLLISVLSVSLTAQTYNFKKYSIEQGLPDRFIYTIQSDLQGYLWIGTGAGLTRFDGQHFNSSLLPDSLEKSYVTTGYTEPSGKLWFGCNDGHVIRFSGSGSPRFYNIRQFSKSSINGFAEDPFGNILVASQNGGIFRITPGDEEKITGFDLGVKGITSFVTDTAGHMIVGTFDGLFIYKFFSLEEPPAFIEQVSLFEGEQIQTIAVVKGEDLILVGTRDKGLYAVHPRDNQPCQVTNMSRRWQLPDGNIQKITEDSKGDIWLATFGDGLIRIERDTEPVTVVKFNSDNGLESTNIKYVFEDFEHNMWFGTYGDGLLQLQNEAFQFIRFPDPDVNNITSITVHQHELIVGNETGLIVRDFHTGDQLSIGPSQGLPVDEVASVFTEEDGTLWIGTLKNGLYYTKKPYQKVNPYFVSADDLERSINDINIQDSSVWVATSNGVFVFDKTTGKQVEHYTTYEGLPYNKINQVYLDKDGRAWIATTSDALYVISPSGQVSRGLVIPNMGGRNEFLSLIKDRNGDIWAGTYGSGLYYFTDDTVLNYSTVSGLLSNYCYSLVEDSKGEIWVGHRSGISRVNKNNNFIRTYSSKDGIAGDVNQGATYADQTGTLWFGTTEGIVTYDARNELPTNIPPRTSILSVTISDQEYPVTHKLVLPYGKYRVRIDYIGISYSNPEAVRYQYMLEGFDDNWSALTPNTFAYYSRIEDGRYTFRLKAYNAFGVSKTDPVTMQIIVKMPFWKAWWFYLVIFILIIGAFVTILKVREQNHIKLQKYLQEELDKRTHEVVAQKEELEVKNKEITDSINYAKRIQASILPPVQRLKDVFPESFVFYQPRDIVSGDFYWWGKVDEDRFLVVCADSTGHGVPGAFMSMIGSTLIKDATQQQRYKTPSQLLSYLDKEITTALNQNLEAEHSNDGMDIVICEINPRTRHIKFASAMRPIILIHQNEQFYIRGNRSAVGGEVLGEKIFDDQEYDLKEGDILYMFSDGYPDQFGGPRGKKFKMVRLKNLIDDIYDKTMDEQWLHIKTNFDTWKGDHDQVDDVLFMGIRLF